MFDKQEYMKAWRLKNREHLRDYAKKYRKQNSEIIKNIWKRRYAKHKGKIIRHVQEWTKKHLEEKKEYWKRYGQINKDNIREKRKRFYLKNIPLFRRRYYKRYNEMGGKEKMREYHKRLRELAIEQYGGKCACCGEMEIKFLALDHINSDGAKHRKEIRGSIYLWVKKIITLKIFYKFYAITVIRQKLFMANVLTYARNLNCSLQGRNRQV